MQSLSLVAPRKLEWVDTPEPPSPGPHDVLLNVDSVGICGSDVHYFSHGRIGSQVVNFPFRLGHELSARIAAVGREVIHLAPGDRVAIEPAMSCKVCDQCRMGRPHTCRNLRFLGCPGQTEGCFSQRMVMPAECCYSVPESLDDDLSALIEPLSIGCYAASLDPRLVGARIAILGGGPIGLSVLLATLAAGVESVYLTEPVAARRAMALELGAHWVGHPEDDAPVETIAAQESLGLDAVFECCGQQSALDQAVALLKPGGKLMLIGIPTQDKVSFSIDPLRRNELIVQNVRRQNGCMREAIHLAMENQPKLRRMITHAGAPAEAQHFFELLETYDDGIVKAMIRF